MALGRAMGERVMPNDVILLTGDLGAGKTQFTRGLGEALGVTSSVTSPTFNILIHHEGKRMGLYHFDLYRLEDGEALEDIDFYETLESEGVSLVEWGDKFEESIQSADVMLAFEVTGPSERVISATALSDRGVELLTSMNGSVV